VPVLLDTGSTGPHIYPRGSRLGAQSAAAVSGQKDSVTFADGTVDHRVGGARNADYRGTDDCAPGVVF
jgi:hypothetical protein